VARRRVIGRRDAEQRRLIERPRQKIDIDRQLGQDRADEPRPAFGVCSAGSPYYRRI
jgi:hypothetical protein